MFCRRLSISFYQFRKYSHNFPSFVPDHQPVADHDVLLLKNFIFGSNKIFVLTGAGISTESGIPDYRSENVGLYARSKYRPIQFPEFLKSEAVRQRYWARNYVGWNRFSQTQPNITHNIVKDLEITYNKVSVVVTQNVDRLHSKAGSKNVIELHGTAYEVICLNCDYRTERAKFQKTLNELNTEMIATSEFIRPDGDVELTESDVKKFQVPACPKCGGNLKPDIVFFGDNIPRQRVVSTENYLSQSDSLLVLGSSLMVLSGYRIVLEAEERGIPIVIVNIGTTRGDRHASLKLSAKCGEILSKIFL